MREYAALERRYRRLLDWYPADHRRAHGEEMIGVLLAAAPDGRRRPSIADTLDLIKGGIQTRLRPGRPDGLDGGWRDTLAVASIAFPALLFIYFAVWVEAFGIPAFAVLLFTALPPLLALRRHRRAAALTGCIPVLFFGFIAAQYMGSRTWVAGQVAGLFLAFLLTALATALSPGPARGLRIMNPKSWTVVCTIGLTVVIPELAVRRLYVQPGIQPSPGWWVIPLGVAAAAAALGLMRTLPPPVGKRLLTLLAIPAYPSLASVAAGGYASAGQYGVEIVYLPTLALACLALARVRQSRGRKTG
jgi:hypothetical protein